MQMAWPQFASPYNGLVLSQSQRSTSQYTARKSGPRMATLTHVSSESPRYPGSWSAAAKSARRSAARSGDPDADAPEINEACGFSSVNFQRPPAGPLTNGLSNDWFQRIATDREWQRPLE